MLFSGRLSAVVEVRLLLPLRALLWGMASEGVLLRECKGHSGAVNAVRFTKDGNYVMSCSDDRTVRLWNPHKADPSKSEGEALLIKKYDGVHGYQILDCAISHVSVIVDNIMLYL